MERMPCRHLPGAKVLLYCHWYPDAPFAGLPSATPLTPCGEGDSVPAARATSLGPGLAAQHAVSGLNQVTHIHLPFPTPDQIPEPPSLLQICRIFHVANHPLPAPNTAHHLPPVSPSQFP